MSLAVAGFAFRVGFVTVPTVDVPDVAPGGEPDVAVRPRSVSFSGVSTGPTATKEVQIHNRGTTPLTIENVSVAGGDAFSLAEPPPETVPAGESVVLDVAFTPSAPRPTAATLVVSTDDDDAPRVPVYLSNTETNVTLGVSDAGNRTRVTADVRNATAGEPVTLSVPRTDATAGDDVQLASLSVTPERDGAFALNATASTTRLATTPPENVSDGVESLGFVSVDHTIDNDDVANATFTYRINRSRLARMESEPSDVALYRYESEGWRRKPTTLAGETDGYYVFRTHSGGLSEWTAAAGIPRIAVTDAAVNVTSTTVDDSVDVDVLLTNTGQSDGLFVTKLLIDGSVVERRQVTVTPNATSLVAFVHPMERPGKYSIEVNGRFVATVTVTPRETTETGGGSGATVSVVAIVVIAAVCLVLVAGGGWYVLGSRMERERETDEQRRDTSEPDDGENP